MKGRLWWIAESDLELANWKTLYLDNPGIKIIKTARLPKEHGRVQIIFELQRSKAPELLGYTPETAEWLEV